MNKTILLSTLGLATAVLAFAASSDVSPRLRAFGDALTSAQSLSATYTVQPLGGSASSVSLALAKPNKARIETATQVIVADGTTVTVFDKGANSFYKQPQTAESLAQHFSSHDLSLFRGFFGPAPGFAVSQDQGTRERGGRRLGVVRAQADTKGDVTMTLYFDSSDSLIRQGEIVVKGLGRETRTIMNVTDIRPEAGADLFAFKAPAGAKEVDWAAMQVGKWFTDFEEARKVAKATGKLMLVDFYAVWCVPCKQMKAEAFQDGNFKKMAKDFVLVMIDAEKQVPLAQRYGVDSYPTVKFIDKDGKVVHEFVGYGGVEQVLGDMRQALVAKGS